MANVTYTDNLKEVDAALRRLAPSGGFVLEASNNAEYARYLNDRVGYYVFSDSELRRRVLKHLRAAINARGADRKVILTALDAAGHDYLDFLRSLTSKMRPPVKAGEGPRQAHPGNWADDKGQLVRSFHHRAYSGAAGGRTTSGDGR